ncbi:MAG: hypothetical protein M3412_00140 [Chloroflexota bacterium]|jgi:uncharacterized membrane protein|nr:hypothetical protein [Chloroflexota bacterium]
MPIPHQPTQPDDRLQREVDEILEKARARPISFQQKVDQKRIAARQQRQQSSPDVQLLKGNAIRLAMKIPILTAIVFAIIAAYLAPHLSFLATLFALAAVVMVFIPFAVRQPETSPADQARWRGRVVSNLPPVSNGRSRGWIDDLKKKLNR